MRSLPGNAPGRTSGRTSWVGSASTDACGRPLLESLSESSSRGGWSFSIIVSSSFPCLIVETLTGTSGTLDHGLLLCSISAEPAYFDNAISGVVSSSGDCDRSAGFIACCQRAGRRFEKRSRNRDIQEGSFEGR